MQEIASTTGLKELEGKTQDWYREYYSRKGTDRNSLLRNPEVLFQNLAKDVAMVRALRSINADARSTRVLDFGCGEGGSMWVFLQLGFEPSNLFGVDIQEERILTAKSRNPVVNFQCADASRLDFRDNTFDIAMESTMFVQLADDGLAKAIAAEMVRVTKVGGTLLLCDWRYPKPGSPEYKALSTRRISKLFEVGTRTEICRTFHGPLVPPVGRFLSKHFSSAYFMIHALFPFLAGQVVTVLRKNRTS